MAIEGGPIKELEEMIVCSVCTDDYNKPKTLPCNHSFCLNCIQKLKQVSWALNNRYFLN